jgi:hypothetical protein
MPERLVICIECSRHLKASEASCPFCGANAVRPSGGDPFRRMAAAAAVAAGVTGFAACSSSSSPSTSVFNGAANVGDAASISTSTSVFVFYGAANIVVDADCNATNPPPRGCSLPADGGSASADDAPSDAGDGSSGDATSSGTSNDAGEDAPSVVAFYGIATPLRDGEADGSG